MNTLIFIAVLFICTVFGFTLATAIIYHTLREIIIHLNGIINTLEERSK